MKLKFSTISLVSVLLCGIIFACSETHLKHEDSTLAQTSSAEGQSTQSPAEKSDEANSVSLLEILQTITNGSVPIESLTEIPFEWETPVQEMVQLAEKYAVNSLDEFRETHKDMIIQESPGCIEAYDESEDLYVTVQPTSMEDIPILIALRRLEGGDSLSSAIVDIHAGTKAISQFSGLNERWPGFHFVRFHSNGNVHQFSYSPTVDGKAVIAQFDEGGQLSECYALPLDAQGPSIRF